MVEKSNNRILLAGASGAIGRRLCRLLVEADWHVTGMTRSAEKAATLRAMGVTPVVVDVFDEEKLRLVVAEAGPAIVMHQLTDLPFGLDPAKMAEARIRNARIRDTGTRNLIAAAMVSGVKRMIAQSIAFAYAPGAMPYREDSSLNLNDPGMGFSARAVASLEQQVMNAPFEGVVLRYGKLYGPGTGFNSPESGGPVHVDAAADAARRALTRGGGIYNIAEEDGTVCSRKAMDELGWNPCFRIN